MSDKKISYLNRTFDDYRAALLDFAQRYYPQISDNLDDASIGSFLVDIAASIGDNLSFHTDRVYNETCIESAQERASVMAIARSNGLKIPGPKASVAEEVFSCVLPVATVENNDKTTVGMPNWAYAPIIKRGTKITDGSQMFELMEDVDFSEQFTNEGVSDRNISPNIDSNGKIVSYTITKCAMISAGETKVVKQIISDRDIQPFMEYIIPDTDVMNVESIIFKDGVNYNSDPSTEELLNPNEFVPAVNSPSGVDTYRYFEVNSLLEQYRWGDDISTTRAGNQNVGQSVKYTYGYYDAENDTTIPTASITKGEWIPLTQKFITEFTDNGYLKIIFGSGESAGQSVDYSKASDFSKAQITRMIRNDFLGRLPRGGWTMYVAYRKGGGLASNVAKGKINTIVYLDATIGKCITNEKDIKIMDSVQRSIKCENSTPSIAGKDAPTIEEIRNMVKYNSGAQERCVTINDYLSRIMLLPPKYGCPFRVSALEANNKIMMYLLGINSKGNLTDVFPEQAIKNIENYLSMYRTVNDFVELKSGRVINLSFEVDIYVDKTYNSGDVIRKVINCIKEYMDINKHELGEDLYISDLEKEITKIDGVLNIIDLRIFNEFGDKYSGTISSQPIIEDDTIPSDRYQLDLDASDYMLVSDSDEMFEIRYPENDISVRVKLR